MHWILLVVVLSPWLALIWRARQHTALILLLMFWFFLLLSTFFSPDLVWATLILGGWLVFGAAYVALDHGRVSFAHTLVAAFDVLGLVAAIAAGR